MTETSRRHFLQIGAAASVAPWVSSAASAGSIQNKITQEVLPKLPLKAIGRPFPGRVTLPKTPPKKKSDDSVGIAIIGLGYYALGIMMPRFAQTERCHVAAIVSGNPDKLKRAGDAYGLPEDARYSYDDFDRIANDDRVDAVYIVLPSGLHTEWAEKAFAAGKHVLCEKPMALTPEECERMISASHKANKKLMIGYRCHFEPNNLKAMTMMGENAVGDIRLIRSNQEYRMSASSSPATNWRANRDLAGFGPLEDYGIYGMQGSLYLTDEMPSSVSATAFAPENDPRFAEIFAQVATSLQFPSGAVAQLFTSYDSPGTNRCFVRGDEAKFRFENAFGYGGQEMYLDQGEGESTVPSADPSVQFPRMLDHFASAIRDNIDIITPGEMGLRDVRLMTAIHTSALEGRTIRLNPDGTMTN